MRLLNNPKTIYVVIAAGVLALILLNFWGWLFLNRLDTQLLDALSRQSRRNSEVYALQISEKFVFTDLFGLSPDDVRLIALEQLLYEFQRAGELENVFVISPDKTQWISPELTADGQHRARQFPVNDSLFQNAQLGEGTLVERVQFGSDYFLTTYTPILNEFGVPTAVLLVEAPADIFATLYFFRRSLIVTAIAGTAVILLFAGLILLAIRQLFQTREMLEKQNRLAELGQMAAMVAHEIRNPLSIIKGSAEVLRKKYRQHDDEMFDFIPDEINRLNRLVSDFLQFAKQRDLALSLQNPDELLLSLKRQFQDERLDFNIPEAVPQLKLNEDAFKQVMINIIENARQSVSAAADGGKILVEIDPKKGGAHTVSIRVTDNGCGMSVETLDRIFEPFYSTRATGSGLGMAITKQLVTQMNGTISVVSQTGKGTTVTVNFPIG